jgi:hypothetical protein
VAVPAVAAHGRLLLAVAVVLPGVAVALRAAVAVPQVAAVVVAAVVAVVAAAGAVERPNPLGPQQENSHMNAIKTSLRLAAALLALAGNLAAAESTSQPSAAPTAPATPAPHYATPDEAIQALLDAVASGESGALSKVLGTEPGELGSGDPVADANALEELLAVAAEAVNIEQTDDDEDLAVVTMGEDDWPFPIPLLRDTQGWYFDAATGKEEIFNRRIGRNELSAIATLRAYVEAQDEYAAEDPNGDGVKEYARRLMSTEGTRDGLYWPTKEGEPGSPMGPLVAGAIGEGYKPGQGGGSNPFHGYLFRAITAQGENAPGGAKDYLVDGHLTGGFAVLAYPAEYGNSGVMSFLVNQSGIVYEADLGSDTATAAAAITAYDPGEGWTAATD